MMIKVMNFRTYFLQIVSIVLLLTLSVPALAIPPTPSGLAASDGTFTDQIYISWNPVPGANQYELWTNINNDPGTANLLAVVASSTTAYVQYDSEFIQPQYYWVTAKDITGISDFSTPDSGWKDLGQVSNLAASDRSSTEHIEITWDSLLNATKYEILRNTSDSIGEAESLGTSITGSTYLDITAIPNKQYFYWIRPGNVYGLGSQYTGSVFGYRDYKFPWPLFLPAIIVKEAPESTWRALTRVTCPAPLTFTVTVDGIVRSSVMKPGDITGTWSGFASATPGIKNISWQATCSSYPPGWSGSLNHTMKDGMTYLIILDDGGNNTPVVYVQ